MASGGVAVYDTTDFKFCKAQIYNNNMWKPAIPYVYTNGEWKVLGGTNCLMIEWYDSNGNLMVDSDGKTILVRERPEYPTST